MAKNIPLVVDPFHDGGTTIPSAGGANWASPVSADAGEYKIGHTKGLAVKGHDPTQYHQLGNKTIIPHARKRNHSSVIDHENPEGVQADLYIMGETSPVKIDASNLKDLHVDQFMHLVPPSIDEEDRRAYAMSLCVQAQTGQAPYPERTTPLGQPIQSPNFMPQEVDAPQQYASIKQAAAASRGEAIPGLQTIDTSRMAQEMQAAQNTSHPDVATVFEIEGFGTHEVYYHRVLRQENMLVLVYDTRCGGRPYIPPQLEVSLGVAVPSQSTAVLASSIGIQFSDGPYQYSVLIVQQDVPGYMP